MPKQVVKTNTKAAKPTIGKAAGRMAGRGISKTQRAPSALALAVAQRKPGSIAGSILNLPAPGPSRPAPPIAAATPRPLSAIFGQWHDEGAAKESALADQLTGLVCECLRQAPEARLPLSELGSRVRDLVKRRGLQAKAADQAQAKLLGNLSLAVKAQWGNWEGFARAREADGLRLRRQCDELRRQGGPYVQRRRQAAFRQCSAAGSGAESTRGQQPRARRAVTRGQPGSWLYCSYI